MEKTNLDWVILKEDIIVKWSGAKHDIPKGTRCRVLRENEDGTVNVSFGFKGIHPLNTSILEPC